MSNLPDHLMTARLPEDCPEPFWHKTHYYCPCCSWQAPDAPKSPADATIDALREQLDDAIMLRDEHRDRANIAEAYLTGATERLAAAEELLLEALPILKPLRHYVNDAVRDRIVRFLEPGEKQDG